MKGITQKIYGGVEVLEEAHLDLPEIKDQDILVKIKGSALNPVDIKKRSNYSNPNAKLEHPFTLGFDGSGVVEKLGKNVSNFKVGDEVYFSGTFQRNGTFSEYTVVDERIVGMKPKKLSWGESASAPLCCLTAYEGIFEQLGVSLNPDDNKNKSLLVIAGAGGVGGYVIQFAKMAGLKVIATASRTESSEFCKKLGADYVIDHNHDLLEGLKGTKEFSNGVNYVYNTASTDLYFEKLPPVLLPLGKAVFINGTGGKFAIGPWMNKRLTFSFEFMFSRPIHNCEPENQGKILNTLSKLFDEGKIKHTMTSCEKFSLENLIKGMKHIESARTIGKISFEQ